MPSSSSRSGRLVLLWVAACLVCGGGCDELNPNYDPDAGPPCDPGARQCSADGTTTQVCRSTAEGFTDERVCWSGSACGDGLCLPVSPVTRCDQAADCLTAGDVCTVFVDPDAPSHLGTFCAPSPNPAGRPNGQACTNHESCLSGWCYRQVCFEACADATQCTNAFHECAVLDVTVDGVRDSAVISGCVPPAG